MYKHTGLALCIASQCTSTQGYPVYRHTLFRDTHAYVCHSGWPPVKCGSADMQIFKRVKCGWLCGFFLRKSRVNGGTRLPEFVLRTTMMFVPPEFSSYNVLNNAVCPLFILICTGYNVVAFSTGSV